MALPDPIRDRVIKREAKMSGGEPRYTVLSKTGKIEIRQYDSRLIAQTTVSGVRESAINDGFSILAAFIFGKNVSAGKIAMTAPVTQTPRSEKIAMAPPVTQTPRGEKIAMAAPVTQRMMKDSWLVQFAMPDKYTFETLPRPFDDRITIVQEEPRKMAVIRFSGIARTRKLKEKENELQEYLSVQKLKSKGEAVYAFYNSPFSLPPLRRNEVMFEIE